MAPYAQKSSTVSNLEMSRRLACHVLLLSFLKNHRDHLLGRKTEEGHLHKCNKALIKHTEVTQKPSELPYGCTSRHKVLSKSQHHCLRPINCDAASCLVLSWLRAASGSQGGGIIKKTGAVDFIMKPLKQPAVFVSGFKSERRANK